MPNIAVVLSGCGGDDGTDVHEAAAAIAALSRAGAEIEMFAPDSDQHDVVDHINGGPMDEEKRSVILESARIARGTVKKLSQLTVNIADAVVIPGGLGAAKNLSDFAFKFADMTVNGEMERVLKDFHSAGKPLALCSFSPMIAAKVLGDKNPRMTLGSTGPEGDWPDQGTIEIARGFGGNMVEKNVDEVCVDSENKIVTTPAFMYNGKFHEIQDGVSAMITELLKLL